MTTASMQPPPGAKMPPNPGSQGPKPIICLEDIRRMDEYSTLQMAYWILSLLISLNLQLGSFFVK